MRFALFKRMDKMNTRDLVPYGPPFARLTFHCRWLDKPARPLHPWQWRDRLERPFRSVCCPFQHRDCSTCESRTACVYVFNFVPAIREDKPSTQVALPFVPRFPRPSDSRGPAFAIGLTLIGGGANYLPYWLAAIRKAGLRYHPPFELDEVAQQVNNERNIIWSGGQERLQPWRTHRPISIESADSLVTIRMITPARLLTKKRPWREVSAQSLINALYKRARLLELWYGDKSESKEKSECLTNIADGLSLAAGPDWHWEEQHYFSKKQKRRVSLSGFRGSLLLEGHLSPYLPLLRAGACWGIGKATSYGSGLYTIVSFENQTDAPRPTRSATCYRGKLNSSS